MSSEQVATSIWYILVLAILTLAFVTRHVALRNSLALLLLWGGILAGAATIYAHRHDLVRALMPAWNPVPATSDRKNVALEVNHIRVARIPLASDNHFWVDGEINGHNFRFLVDSGASITALSMDTVRQAGLFLEQHQPGVIMTTANGRVTAYRTNISGLNINGIVVNDLGAVSAPQFGEINVLGMNFLSRLKSWKVENDVMELTQ